jgi:DegV family protein with EDD domain
MRKVAIVADSPVTLAEEFIAENNISIVPFHVIDDDRDYPDTEVDMDWLYSRLQDKVNLPTTSCPSPGQFLQAFRECARKEQDIICITMTAAFTKGYQAALDATELARKEFPETRIELIDSRTAEAGEMILVIGLAEAVKEGKSFEDIVELANELKLKMNTLQTFDTLFYREKGGRILKADSWAKAEAVTRFKAIIEVDASAGKLTKPIARAKTKNEILRKMVDIATERIGNKKLHAAIVHGDVPEQATKLKEMLLSKFSCEKVYINQALAVTAVHAGKGFISFGFYGS